MCYLIARNGVILLEALLDQLEANAEATLPTGLPTTGTHPEHLPKLHQ